MKKTGFFFITSGILLLLSSCQDKTLQNLCKRWDCVKVENIDPVKSNIQSSEDSLAAVKIEAALKDLNWNFSKDLVYQCSIGNKVTVSGSYQLLNEGKMLLCTSQSKNVINTYTINTLTADELILSSRNNNANIIMHFSPH